MTTAYVPDAMNLGRNRENELTPQDFLDRRKLFTMNDGLQVLRSTEPLAYRDLDIGDSLRFRVGDEHNESVWASGLHEMHGTEAIPVYLSVDNGENDSTEYQLTVDAFAAALKMFGLGFKYATKCPAHLVEDQLNWWFRTGLENCKGLNLMTVGEDQRIGSAITRSTIKPFSNLRLVEQMVGAIHGRFPGVEIFFDATKMSHSLKETYLQLVIPELGHVMSDTGTDNDIWWGGVQLKNYLAGDGQTSVEAFLYRPICTNGMIDTGPTASAWSRKTGGQDEEDVYLWAQQAVDGVLGGLEDAFDAVQHTAHEGLDNEMAQTVRDFFAEQRVPGALQRAVLDELVDTDNLTMYSVLNAMTSAANDDTLTTGHQQLLMSVGGTVARHSERCGECRRIKPE